MKNVWMTVILCNMQDNQDNCNIVTSSHEIDWL